MKILTLFISIIFLSFIGIEYSFAKDCSKFEKLSKEYAKCNGMLLKKKATAQIYEGKKKFNKLKLKEKLIKFKNSKNHKEFMEKIKK